MVVVLSWATSNARDDLGIANTALLLAAITVAAASSSSLAGVVTACAAAFALNFFHTEPVHSLRITSGSDVMSVVLLAGMGLSVSAVTAARARRDARRRSAAQAHDARAGLRAMLDGSARACDVFRVAGQASSSSLDLFECRLLVERPEGLSVVARTSGADLAGNDRLVIPQAGAVVTFADPRSLGFLVVTPREAMGSVTIERRLLTSLADQVEVALHRPPPS